MNESINKINGIYHSEEGDQLAREELLPVVQRFIKKDGAGILEIGCGFGRNLVALSQIPGAQVVGCDIDAVELDQAKKRLDNKKIDKVELVLQTAENKLPFADNSFDFVVAWQVLEHVLSKDLKKSLLCEMTRVVRDGGYVLVETPNGLFPIDYHDTNLPLVHWLFTKNLRQKLIKIIRKADWPASQYANLYFIRNSLRACSGIARIEKVTGVYFEDNYFDIFGHLGGTRKRSKKILFILYMPFYFLLKIFFLSGDLFTPSLRLVYKIYKK